MALQNTALSSIFGEHISLYLKKLLKLWTVKDSLFAATGCIKVFDDSSFNKQL